VEDTRSAKVENIVADAHAMLESILASPHSSGDRAAEVRDLLFNITQWLALRPSDYLRVEELWEKFRKVELLASGSIDAPSQDGEETDEYLILLTPMSAACIGKESSFSFNYSDSPDLLKAVRDLVREAALYYSDDLQEAITEPAPQCTMCGECCGRNRVEITPYDVEGLSDHLGVSEDTFRRRYTQPTPFSWSTGRVIFRQKDGKCVFIRKTGEGLLACSIYERRPQICRSYGARSRLCFQANLGEYWHRRAGTIVGITVGNGEILVASVNTIDRGSPPIRIREDPSTPLGAQIRRLRRAIRLRNPAPGNQSPANPAYR
jgi:Fe-S-cluster containining protein